MKKNLFITALIFSFMMFCTACGGNRTNQSEQVTEQLDASSVKDETKKSISVGGWTYSYPSSANAEAVGEHSENPHRKIEEKEIFENTEPDFIYHELEDGTIMIDNYIGKDTSIYIPEKIGGKKVTRIGKLKTNREVTEVVLPSSIHNIDNAAFQNWSNLKLAYMLNSELEIGKYAFANCQRLEEVYIMNVKIIGKGAFSGCSELKSIQLAELSLWSYFHTLEEDVFAGCEKLENIVMPENLKEIKKNCFTGCERLKAVRVAKKVTRIDSFPENAVMIADENSYAYQYALEHDIKCSSNYILAMPAIVENPFED